MARAFKIIRRGLQSVLLGLTVLGLVLSFATHNLPGPVFSATAVFATLFTFSVLGEAYSHWWERRHAHLSRAEVAALRNRRAIYVLGGVMGVLLLLMIATANGLPWQLVPLATGVIASLQFARSLGKK